MNRTQIYLTEEQRQLIERRAADAGVAKAVIVRELLDHGLGIDGGRREAVAAVDATAGLLADHPDWPDWLAAVRGRSTKDRLRDLGL